MQQASKPRIYIITKGGVNFPSTRFRVQQYLPHFAAEGFDVLAEKPPRGLSRLRCWWRHRNRDILLVQKRFISAPERLLLRLLFRTVLYDFDDALGVPFSTKQVSRPKLWREARQLRAMCRWADELIVCNETLRELARRPDAKLLPTPYERDAADGAEAVDNTAPDAPPLRLLWVGMDMSKLRPWEGELAELAADERVAITLCSHKPEPPDFAFKFAYERWSREGEAALLARHNVGLMPLPNDLNSRGKCALKIIQYMAHGLLPVASDVGFNREVVRQGIDGLLCVDGQQMLAAMRELLDGEIDLDAMLPAARERAASFSAAALYPRLREILLEAHRRRTGIANKAETS